MKPFIHTLAELFACMLFIGLSMVLALLVGVYCAVRWLVWDWWNRELADEWEDER